MFKILISKKSSESLKEAEELDKRFKNLIGKKRLESFKEYSKKAEYIDPQIRVKVLRKKLNNLPETSSDKTSDETSNEKVIIIMIIITIIMIMMIVKIIKLAIL